MARDLKYGLIHIPGIPDDEPVFVIRGKDLLSGTIVDEYGLMAEKAGSPQESVERVREAATILHLWPNKKIPD